MSNRQMGASAYNAELARIRNAVNATRNALERIINETVGPQTLAVLVAKMAVQQGTIMDAISNLDQIGKDAKQERKNTGR